MAKSSDRASSPLHLAISEQIRLWLESGQYRPGDRLPSEHQLMAQFNVSRITIRRAISNLMQQGLVVSQRGKGVFVKEQRKVIYSLSSPFMVFDAAMRQQGLTTTIKTLMFELISTPEFVCQKLNLTLETEVYLQKKVMVISGTSAVLDVSYLIADLGKAFASELMQNMTFAVLENHQVTVDRVEAVLSSRLADAETSQLLNLPLGSPLLVYEHTAYTTGDRAILYGETLSSAESLSYSVTLKRDV